MDFIEESKEIPNFIAELLNENSTIESLDLSFNRFGEEGITSINL